MSEKRRGSLWWGPAILEFLLPLARRGGDDDIRSSSGRLGFELTPRTLEALVAAYWLSRVRHLLETNRSRITHRQWVERNVHAVLLALDT